MISKRKLFGNSFSLLVNRLTQSITSFVLIAAIARLLGTHELGQFLLASSYYLIFMTLTSQGLKILLIRDLSRDPQETPTYLVSGSLLQILFSIVGYIGLVLCVVALPYSLETTLICCLLGLEILPFSLWNVTEAIFQSRDQMHLITLSVTPVYILRVIVICWGMLNGLGLYFVAQTLVLSEALVLIIQWLFVVRIVSPCWKIDWNFIRTTVMRARTLMALEGFAMLSGRSQIIILSLFTSELLVGLYGGITQLIQPFQIVSNSLISATFPSLSRNSLTDVEHQRTLLENTISILLSIAIPCFIGTFFLGNSLLVFVYKDSSFMTAGLIFPIAAFGMITSSLIQPLGYLLVANNLERVNLREVFISGFINIFIGAILIWKYQLIGAAATIVIGGMISLSQYIYSVYVRLFKLRLLRILRYPLILSFLVFAMFWGLEFLNLGFFTSLSLSVLLYTLLLMIVSAHALGGATALMKKVFPRA